MTHFAFNTDGGAAHERTLTPDELTALACRLSESGNPTEAEKLKSTIASGFYREGKLGVGH